MNLETQDRLLKIIRAGDAEAARNRIIDFLDGKVPADSDLARALALMVAALAVVVGNSPSRANG